MHFFLAIFGSNSGILTFPSEYLGVSRAPCIIPPNFELGQRKTQSLLTILGSLYDDIKDLSLQFFQL